MSLWLDTSNQEGFVFDCVSGMEYVWLYFLVHSYVWSLSALVVGSDRHVPCFGLDDVVVVFPFSVVVVCVLDFIVVCKGTTCSVPSIIYVWFSSLIVVC